MRTAWYALGPGRWRDYVTLLHVPYTAWHLSYVVVGGCLVGTVLWDRLGLTVAAFALALGVGAHALDELRGRPLQTTIPDRVLVALAVLSIGGACAIGVLVAVMSDLWLLAFVAAGAFLVTAYNLELFGGRVHGDIWFALSWGAFPVLTAYFAVAGELRVEALLAAAWAALLSRAQRALSTPARRLRRSVHAVEGTVLLTDGRRETLAKEELVAPAENALKLLTASTIALAVALVALRAF